MTILQKHLVFIPLFIVLFAALFGFIVMVLWNWLMPDLLGLQPIGFWQAVGLHCGFTSITECGVQCSRWD